MTDLRQAAQQAPKPLPCPFCGHVGLSHNEGSTFRWLTTECNGCGAQCGEERIDTLSKDQGTAIEQAKEAAIKTWNTRAALEQQAEPGAQSDLIKRLRDTASKGVSVWGDLQMAAAQEIEILTAQRTWVGLTDEEITELDMEISGRTMDECVRAIEAKLKAKNGY
jgi:hypothetical protein